MKRNMFLGLAIFVLMVLVFSGIWINSEKLVVETVRVGRGDVVASITATGRIKPAAETEIRAKINAVIDQLLVSEGDTVKKGDKLIQFDEYELRNALQQAQIKLRQAEYNLTKVAKFNYEQSVIDRKRAERNLKLAEELYKSEGEAELALKERQDTYDNAVLAEKRAKLDLEVDAIHRKDLALREVELIRSQLEKLDLRAEHDGIVIFDTAQHGLISLDGTGRRENIDELHKLEGATVIPGQSLFSVADPSKYHAIVEVDEVDLGNIKVGQRAIVSSEAFPENELEGTVLKLAPNATVAADRTYIKATIDLKGSRDLLIAGMQVDVNIVTGESRSTLYVPVNAVQADRDGYYLWLLENGVAVKRNVEVGISSIDRAEILSGIDEEDDVIIPGHAELREGQEVMRIK